MFESWWFPGYNWIKSFFLQNIWSDNWPEQIFISYGRLFIALDNRTIVIDSLVEINKKDV